MSCSKTLTDILPQLTHRLEAGDYVDFQDCLSQLSLDELIKLQSACSFILESSINLYTGYNLIQDALRRAESESKYEYASGKNFSHVVVLD